MDEDEDECVFYGTPLPEIEDETVLRKKAARELEVRDDKGRQRFHGAFTGGFSAGYFNTVGTKEGWAPSAFVSSRSKVADRVKQTPEDFMDVEDFGEFGISTRRIHTTSEFQDPSHVETRKRKYPELDSVIPGEAPLKDLVKPVSKSIGIQILNKLGWRVGQGIGPRVKKQEGSTKMYGCSPFPNTEIPEEEDPMAFSFTFAPKDTNSEYFKPKDDVFGLGYTGLSKESILGSHTDIFNPTTTKSFLKKDKKKLTISGQAFGVGAFEDDDEDIYSKDDMSQYDFSDLVSIESALTAKGKEYQKFHNSSNDLLDGFCEATKPTPVKKHYPPPELPHHYRPLCSILPKIQVQAEPKLASRHSLSSADRSLLLGGTKFQPFQMKSNKKTTAEKGDLSDKLPSPTPLNNSHSFRPFPNDELKQRRYEDYLKLKAVGEVEKLIQPSSMTEWEKQQELEEFARASVLFKPLSAALSSKFESKSHLSVEHEIMDALAKAKKENAEKSTWEKRKLVGKHNRKTVEWHPISLLCKRFNVPNPYPNSSESCSNAQKSISLFEHISLQTNEAKQHSESSVSTSDKSSHDQISKNTSKSVENFINSAVPVGNKEDEKVIPDTTSENKKPAIDFFKDIFENSSSEDENESTTETKVQSPKSPVHSSLKVSDVAKESIAISNTDSTSLIKANEGNKKSGFGVFSNLDLDALNQRKPAKQTVIQNNSSAQDDPGPSDTVKGEQKITESVADNQGDNQTLSSDLYGPKLPPNYSELTFSSSNRVEYKKHSKHKVKHKHKHHKHKSKKRKKKKSSHISSDDSPFNSDEDIPPTIIIEKLKKLQKVLKTDL